MHVPKMHVLNALRHIQRQLSSEDSLHRPFTRDEVAQEFKLQGQSIFAINFTVSVRYVADIDDVVITCLLDAGSIDTYEPRTAVAFADNLLAISQKLCYAEALLHASILCWKQSHTQTDTFFHDVQRGFSWPLS